MTKNKEKQGYPVNLLKALFGNEPIPDHTASYFDSVLRRVLDELPEKNRSAIINRYRDGMTSRLGQRLAFRLKEQDKLHCGGFACSEVSGVAVCLKARARMGSIAAVSIQAV